MRSVWSALRGRSQAGTATAELALILPMILLLALGTLEFGRVFQASVVANNAAREGARAAALGFSTSAIQNDVVLPYLQASGLAPNVGVLLPTPDQVLVNPASGAPGELVTVYVPLWVELSVPLIKPLVPDNPVKVGANATMRRQ